MSDRPAAPADGATRADPLAAASRHIWNVARTAADAGSRLVGYPSSVDPGEAARLLEHVGIHLGEARAALHEHEHAAGTCDPSRCGSSAHGPVVR